MEHNQIGRVGDWQDERGRIRNHCAGKQVRHRLNFSLADSGKDGRRQHHGGRVVGHENRREGSNPVDQEKESSAFTVGPAG